MTAINPDFLRAPFPWFGGKSVVAEEIWRRFGDVQNYVEPFVGSAAALLGRPPSKLERWVETINDKDGFVVNFWRAVSAAPEAVATWCSWPVSERDLEARHYWLVTEGRAILDRILTSPTAFDARIAGWWAWGACCWIGSGWCGGGGPWVRDDDTGEFVKGDDGIGRQLPKLSAGSGSDTRTPQQGVGVNKTIGIGRQLPRVGDGSAVGVNRAGGIGRKLPRVGAGASCCPQQGVGINSTQGIDRKRPVLAGGNGDAYARQGIGINGGICRQRPVLSGGNVGEASRGRGINAGFRSDRDVFILDWLMTLHSRLREVRMTCGDWSRVCSPAVTWRHGRTAIFLDPPYDGTRVDGLYAHDSLSVWRDVVAWAVENGDRPDMLIAYCGYFEHSDPLFPPTWDRFRWKAGGGYGNQGDGTGRANAERECIWFSPACKSVKTSQASMLDLVGRR